MIRRLVPLLLSLLATVALAQVDPVGSWRGALGPGSLNLEIRVTIEADEAGTGLVGTIDIPAQGLFGYPLVDVVLDGGALGFVMPGIPGNPTFAGDLDGDRVEGTFTQSGQAFPFELAREAEPADLRPRRPQEPQPPFPYHEEEVVFASGEVTLAGTLTLPPGDARVPALLLIPGSGPQDRNEEIMGHKPFLVIADHLTRAGYAVLRVDDRGVGGSTGSDALATYDDLLGDVLAGVALLRAQPRVDPDRVGLLGHSQGGYLAPPAAVAGDVDGAHALVRERVLSEVERLQPDQRPDAASVEQVVAVQQAHATSPSFVAFLTFDPQPHLRSLTVPTLALFGELDAQVPPDQSEGPMREALVTAGNPDATGITFPGLNHLMQPAITGSPNEYALIETTIAPVVLETITDWLRERFPAP